MTSRAESNKHTTHSHMPTIVYPDGSVLNVPSVNLRFTCVMDLTYWPHDTHNCSLEIGSWVHNGHQLDMQLEASGLEVREMHKKEWLMYNSLVYDWFCVPDRLPVYFFYVLLVCYRYMYVGIDWN